MLFLCGKDSFPTWAKRLCDLEWFLGLSDHDVPPFKILLTLLHPFICCTRFAVSVPSQGVMRVLWASFNQNILNFNGHVGRSLSASGYRCLLYHINVWFFASTLDFTAVCAVVHYFAQLCEGFLFIVKINFVDWIFSCYRTDCAQGVSLMFLLQIDRKFRFYFMWGRFVMILPGWVIARLHSSRDPNPSLLHYSFADFVCLYILVVTNQLDALIIWLSLSKHILVCAE